MDRVAIYLGGGGGGGDGGDGGDGGSGFANAPPDQISGNFDAFFVDVATQHVTTTTLLNSLIYTNGDTPAKIAAVLNGQNLQVLLEAHVVTETLAVDPNLIFHLWIQVQSTTATGALQSYSISFEPSDFNPVHILNWQDNLVTRIGDDDSSINVINPVDLTQSGIMPAYLKSQGAAGVKEFAAILTHAAQMYNGSETYKPTVSKTRNPLSPEDMGAYNSNSGIGTILQMAKVSLSALPQTVTLNQNIYTVLGYFTGYKPGQALNLDKTALGVTHTMPHGPGDFNQPYGYTNNYSTKLSYTTDPVQALLNSGFIKDIVLNDPALAKAFDNLLNSALGQGLADIGALATIVDSIEKIGKGGLLNIVTGLADIVPAAIALHLLPETIDDIPTAEYIQENGLGAAETIVSAIGDVQSIINGFDAGGIDGAVEAGVGADNLLWLAKPLLDLLSKDFLLSDPEIALGVAVVVALVTLVFGGNHDNPADMPDKYDNPRFTLYTGELQGHSSTAYGPAYDPTTDPIQSSLGGLSMLDYIQQWIGYNLNSSNAQVSRLAQQLLTKYGDSATGATGQLAFQHDLANESVTGGSESGTYVSIYSDASQALGEIELTDSAVPNDVVLPQTVLQPPSTDYGNLDWTPFYLPNNAVGYWAPTGNGMYYYFGPDDTLYEDSYPGEVQPADTQADLVGNVQAYDFSVGGVQTLPTTTYYGS